jgi:dienelactone hydrolase
MTSGDYDPFVTGPHPVGSRTWQARDEARDQLFTCEIWYPAEADQERGAGPGGRPPGTPREADENGEQRDAVPLHGPHPLVVFSHFSGGGRRMSSFLCRHLASHGYAVAAMDHSEVTAPELAAQPGETPEQRPARVESIMASRVPDVRFLLAHLTSGKPPSPSSPEAGPGVPGGAVAGPGAPGDAVAGLRVPGGAVAGPGAPGDIELDVDQLGLVGHSFGGWTALATPDVERRVRAVAALAPGGSSRPRPGILPLSLDFAWGRDVPTLYLAADSDVGIPADGVAELYDRTPATKRMFILRRADHQHFLDNVEVMHEFVRSMNFTGDSAWIPGAMRPITELCSGEAAHLFTRGLTLAHLDAWLRQSSAAKEFFDGDVVAGLTAHGVEATEYRG